MSKLKLGIVGVGNMGTAHLSNIMSGLCPEINVVAVADIDPLRLASVKDKYGDKVLLFDTAEKMLDSGKIDSAIIAVPHYDHPKYAIECFKRNIHVVVEKPAGVYTKQVKEMNMAADESDSVFAMMFNQRTNCIYRKMREIVKSGEMGNIKRTNWIITNWYRPQAYYDSGSWRATWAGEGGGVLLNQSPHNLDLWQWICGMPKKVRAYCHNGKWHNIEVEDDVTAYVEYENGATGVFITSTGDTPGTNRFEITLEKGKLVCENDQLYMWRQEVSEAEFSKQNTIPFKAPENQYSEVETDGQSLQHVGVLNAFAANVLRGEPLIADGREGINGLILSNAMHLSSWLDQEIVLPFDDEQFYIELQKRVNHSKSKQEFKTAQVADMSHTYNA